MVQLTFNLLDQGGIFLVRRIFKIQWWYLKKKKKEEEEED